MPRILLVAVFILIATVTTVTAIEISDEEPISLKLRLTGEPPIDTSDESSLFWIPKTDLGITLDEATKGLDKIIPKVTRVIGPGGDPGFDGKSSDEQIWLGIWGTEMAIKTMRLKIPFCVDPYRFSLGSWSDAEKPIEIFTSFLNGAFPYRGGRENRELVDGLVKEVLSQPLLNMFNNKVETLDGCVLFKTQFHEPLVRKLSDKVEVTFHPRRTELSLEITPPRNKMGGAANSTDKTKSDGEEPTNIREILQAYILDVQAVMSGGNRDEKLARALLSLKTSSEALLP
ncbi:MAG: hypothetical protein ACLPVO_07905 [Desulfomonilaceae bacterium]